MNIVTLVQHSTQYYVFDTNQGKLIFDCGWPGELAEFKAIAKRAGIRLSDFKYILCSHYHMDHAGLAQDLKNIGAKLILMESQVGFPKQLSDYVRHKGMPMTEILETDNLLLKFPESRAFLAGIGIAGEIIPTPGHGNDHVTLILDDGSAFTGDLPPRPLVMDEQTEMLASWERIHQHNVTRIYPSHGPQHHTLSHSN